jgi:hypothetical protein
VTALVTLVVHSVLPGVRTATTHLLIGHFPPPGHYHIITVDGIVPRPEYPLIYPKKPPFIDEGFDKPHHMPDGKPCDRSETLISNPGVLPKEVGFGEDSV